MQLLVFVSDVCITEMAVLLILLLQRWSGVRPTLMTIINSSKRICFFYRRQNDVAPVRWQLPYRLLAPFLTSRVLLVVFGISASLNVDKGFNRLCC